MNPSTDGHDKSQRQSFPCPECGFFMEVSSTSLLYGNYPICPACGITLRIDRTASKDALADLIQLQMAAANPKSGKNE